MGDPWDPALYAAGAAAVIVGGGRTALADTSSQGLRFAGVPVQSDAYMDSLYDHWYGPDRPGQSFASYTAWFQPGAPTDGPYYWTIWCGPRPTTAPPPTPTAPPSDPPIPEMCIRQPWKCPDL